MPTKVFILIFALLICATAVISDDCVIPATPNVLSPLVLRTKSENDSDQFLYPEPGQSTLTIPQGKAVDFVCPSSSFTTPIWKVDILQGVCKSAQIFVINTQDISFNTLRCNNLTVGNGLFKRGNQPCWFGSARLAEIGFRLSDGRFLRTIEICFDSKFQGPLYTYHKLLASKRTLPVRRSPIFEQDSFYKITNVNLCYQPKTQRHTINDLLDLLYWDETYIQKNRDYALSRGHLAPANDFYYATQQMSSFHFINVAPQWQIINKGDWNLAEIAVKNYATARKVHLSIWTGVYSIASITRNSKKVDLFLYVKESEDKALPVPRLYWKVVYNPKTMKGVALIGSNNPYDKTIPTFLKTFCRDVKNNVNWLKKMSSKLAEPDNMIACSVSDFRTQVPQLPTFPLRSKKNLLN